MPTVRTPSMRAFGWSVMIVLLFSGLSLAVVLELGFECGQAFTPERFGRLRCLGIGQSLVLQSELALGISRALQCDADPGAIVRPVEAGRPAWPRGAFAHHGAGQPAFALLRIHEGVVEAFDGHPHRLAGAEGEGAAGPYAGWAQPPRLLVLDDQLLCPPAADVMLGLEPVGDLSKRTAGRTPPVEQGEPLVVVPAGCPSYSRMLLRAVPLGRNHRVLLSGPVTSWGASHKEVEAAAPVSTCRVKESSRFREAPVKYLVLIYTTRRRGSSGSSCLRHGSRVPGLPRDQSGGERAQPHARGGAARRRGARQCRLARLDGHRHGRQRRAAQPPTGGPPRLAGPRGPRRPRGGG